MTSNLDIQGCFLNIFEMPMNCLSNSLKYNYPSRESQLYACMPTKQSVL